MPVEEIKLTARFKVDLTDVDKAAISEIHRLFKEYQRIVNELIEYAHSHRTTSFIALCHVKYRELRQRYPTLPSHYIVTACKYAASIYESFIELKELGICEKERPIFKGRTVWLDDHLFKLDAENWRASIAVHGGGWSYSRFQRILEYQAKLHRLSVKYVDPRNTSRTCPVCGSELKENSNGRRLMKCQRCGLEEDRDVVAVRNLTRRYYEECIMPKFPKTSLDRQRRIDVGSPRSPRKPPNEKREEGLKAQNTAFMRDSPPFPFFLPFIRANQKYTG